MKEMNQKLNEVLGHKCFNPKCKRMVYTDYPHCYRCSYNKGKK